MNRRSLFLLARRALLWLMGGLAAWPVLSFVSWRANGRGRVVFSPAEQKPYARKDDVYLLPEGSGFAALSASCPHLCCPVVYDANARAFRCPCHRSVFNHRGERLSGPAPSGLKRLQASLLKNGDLEVRTT